MTDPTVRALTEAGRPWIESVLARRCGSDVLVAHGMHQGIPVRDELELDLDEAGR